MAYEPLVAADDDNGRRDIYERFNGQTNLVSTGPATTNALVEATWGGNTPDGASVYFTTEEKLVSADTDSARDVYERTRLDDHAHIDGPERRQRSAARLLRRPRRSTARGSSSPPRSRS